MHGGTSVRYSIVLWLAVLHLVCFGDFEGNPKQALLIVTDVR